MDQNNVRYAFPLNARKRAPRQTQRPNFVQFFALEIEASGDAVAARFQSEDVREQARGRISHILTGGRIVIEDVLYERPDIPAIISSVQSDLRIGDAIGRNPVNRAVEDPRVLSASEGVVTAKHDVHPVAEAMRILTANREFPVRSLWQGIARNIDLCAFSYGERSEAVEQGLKRCQTRIEQSNIAGCCSPQSRTEGKSAGSVRTRHHHSAGKAQSAVDRIDEAIRPDRVASLLRNDRTVRCVVQALDDNRVTAATRWVARVDHLQIGDACFQNTGAEVEHPSRVGRNDRLQLKSVHLGIGIGVDRRPGQNPAQLQSYIIIIEERSVELNSASGQRVLRSDFECVDDLRIERIGHARELGRVHRRVQPARFVAPRPGRIEKIIGRPLPIEHDTSGNFIK